MHYGLRRSSLQGTAPEIFQATNWAAMRNNMSNVDPTRTQNNFVKVSNILINHQSHISKYCPKISTCTTPRLSLKSIGIMFSKCQVAEVSKTSHSPRQCHGRLNLFNSPIYWYPRISENIGKHRKILVRFAPLRKEHVASENHQNLLDVGRLVHDSCNLKTTTGPFIANVFWTLFFGSILFLSNWTTCSKMVHEVKTSTYILWLCYVDVNSEGKAAISPLRNLKC